MSTFYKAGTKVLTLNSKLLIPHVGGAPVVYQDNFDSYGAVNDYLAGLGNWIHGIGDMVCWDTGGGNNQIGPYCAGDSACIYNQTLAANQYAQVKRTRLSGGAYIGIGVRLTGSDTTFCGYAFGINDYNNASVLVRYDNGVEVLLGNIGTTNPSLNDVYKLKVVGSVLTVYKNGSIFTEVGTGGTYTDSTYATGKAGIMGYGTANDTLGDEWEGGEI